MLICHCHKITDVQRAVKHYLHAATASAARADDNIVSLISTAIDVAAAAAAPSVDDTGNSVDNAVDTDSTVCMLDDTILTADNFSDGV